MLVVVLAVVGGHKTEHAAVDVGHAFGFVLLADMAGDGDDIAHEHLYVGEDGGVDVLEDVVGGAAFGDYLIRGVDEAVAEGFYFCYVALDGKLSHDVLKVFLFHGYKIKIKVV